mgnify:CR=1 FL=1
MLEAGTMLLFCAVLFASVALGWSIIPALFVGVLLFMGYGPVSYTHLTLPTKA